MVQEEAASKWERLAQLAEKGQEITAIETREIIKLIPSLFKEHLISNGVDPRKAQALVTKFRDAGRRSAPWKAFSTRIPGRPQDGADGNRINRWLLPKNHKFYADEKTATLVEIKYFLQTLSMEGAPSVPDFAFQKNFKWLVGHDVAPGEYYDPVLLEKVSFAEVVNEPRVITSGHIFPLDRGGTHTPENTFLMLKQSNDLQGNKTLPELLVMIEGILRRHSERS
jgi:hypothetical protein